MRTMRIFTNGQSPSQAAGRDDRPAVTRVRLSVLVIALAPLVHPATVHAYQILNVFTHEAAMSSRPAPARG